MSVTQYNKDKELINLVRQKSRKGFEKLYCQYAGAMYGVIRQMITEECIAQRLLEETLTSAWIKIEEYNEKEQSFFIWLLFICRRICKQQLRNEMPVREAYAALTEKNKEVDPYKSVIEMVLLRGQSCDEVAKSMNIPASAVLSHTRTGLQLLKKDRE